MDKPNDNILLPMLSLDFMPTFIPQQYVGFGAARCDDTVSASGLSACDIFQCVVYDPPGLWKAVFVHLKVYTPQV